MRVNVINVRDQVLRERGIVTQGYLDRDLPLDIFDIDRLGNELLTGSVDVLDKLPEAAFCVKRFGSGLARLIRVAIVVQRNANTWVEERQLAEARCHRLIVVFHRLEDLRIRSEMDRCTPTGRFAYNPDGELGAPPLVLLAENLPLAVYCRGKLFG